MEQQTKYLSELKEEHGMAGMTEYDLSMDLITFPCKFKLYGKTNKQKENKKSIKTNKQNKK